MTDNPLTKYLQLFRNLPAADLELINNAFQLKQFKENEHLFTAGHICREMYFIISGVLKIVLLNEKGNWITYFFLKENQFCTILNSFNNEVATEEGIQAACDAQILAISKTKLYELYNKLPYLKGLIDGITQQALLDKIQIRNSYLGQDSATRYHLFMSRQADIALRVSLTDVASYLGITPQSLSRIRKNIHF